MAKRLAAQLAFWLVNYSPFFSFSPNTGIFFPRNTMFCLCLICNVMFLRRVISKFTSVFKRSIVSYRLN